jgi:predicted lipid-binding transport protein (Tim44 family)
MFGFFNTVKENRDDRLPLFEQKFLAIQDAVGTNNRDILEAECTEEMYDFFMQCKADNIRNRTQNVVENVIIKNMFTRDTFFDEDLDQDFHAVIIQFTMSDYFIDESGNIVGSIEPQFIEETWVFTRNPNHNVWLLASIEDN